MLHILQVSKEQLTKVKDGKKSLLLKPKREIKNADTVVLESEGEQVQTVVSDIQTEPGLKQGFVLLTLEV